MSMDKILVRYKHGLRPNIVQRGTDESLKAKSAELGLIEVGDFYVSKENPRLLGGAISLFRGPFPKYDYYMILDEDKFVIKQNKSKLPETMVPADGRKKWYGGAWTIAFVYSNRGNFVLKGYMKEVEEKLSQMRKEGLKYFVNLSMWCARQHRSLWSTSGNGSYIDAPGKHNKFNWVFKRYRGDKSETIKFKRLPNRWVPEIDKMIS